MTRLLHSQLHLFYINEIDGLTNEFKPINKRRQLRLRHHRRRAQWGWVAAAYLAKAGKKVCVLERRSMLGGMQCNRGNLARLQSLYRLIRRQPDASRNHQRTEA